MGNYLLIPLLVIASLYSFTTSAQKGNEVIIQKSFENGELFFIMPQEMETQQKDIEFEADFTINYQKDQKQPEKVQMNFTIFSAEPVKQLSSMLLLVNGQEKGVVRTFEKFYLEKKGRNTWAARFGARIDYDQLLSILNPEHEIRWVLKTIKEKIEISPARKIKKEYEVAYQTLTYHFE